MNVTTKKELVGLAFLSGVMSFILVGIEPNLAILLLMFGQGFIYGICTLRPVLRLSTKKLRVALIWLFGTTVSYILGVQAVFRFAPGNLLSPDPDWMHFMLGGAIGALIVALTYKLVERYSRDRITPHCILITTIIGAMNAGGAMFLSNSFGLVDTDNFSILYIIWPTVVTLTLVINTKPKES